MDKILFICLANQLQQIHKMVFVVISKIKIIYLIYARMDVNVEQIILFKKNQDKMVNV